MRTTDLSNKKKHLTGIMLGIKSPDVLNDMSLMSYRKKLGNTVRILIRDTKKAPDTQKQFAIFNDFTFGDGEQREVLLIGFNSKWLKFIKAKKKAKEPLILGYCTVKDTNLNLVVRSRTKYPESDAEKDLREHKITATLSTEGLQYQWAKPHDGEENEMEDLDQNFDTNVVFKKIKRLIDEYKTIDEEDEISQMKKLEEIETEITTAEGFESNKLVQAVQSNNEKHRKFIKSLRGKVTREIQAIELELKEEAWEDYYAFIDEKTRLAEEQLKVELLEIEELYDKWETCFFNREDAVFKTEMADLFNRIKAELKEYHQTEEDLSETEDLVGKVRIIDIKQLITALRKIPRENAQQRIEAITRVETAIESWINEHPESGRNEQQEKQYKKILILRSKLRDARVDAIATVNTKFKEVNRDFLEFDRHFANFTDDFQDLYDYLDDVTLEGNHWLTQYGDMKIEAVDKMDLLLKQVQERKQAIELIERKSEDLDQLIEQFDTNHDLAARRQILVNFDQEYELFLALTED